MAESLTITSVGRGDTEQSVLKFSGKLGLDSVPDFLKAVRAESAKNLILDIEHMSYVDSSGIGALVQQLSALKKEGRQMVLVRPHERVMAVLQITKVAGLFTRFNSVEEATAQLK